MFFTQEDYKKIQTWLNQNAIKDSEFKEASLPLNEYDIISFVQNGNNVKVRLKDFLEQLFLLREFSDFINVTDKYKDKYILLKQAIQLVPYKTRKIGQVITFLNDEKEWKIYQFKGESVNQWNEESLWEDIIKAIQGSDLVADEEDLTEVVDEVSGKSLLKLKDKAYDPDNFSGLGRVILRKNIVTILNQDTQEGQDINLLTQQMINKPNTIYEIQYDFDLNNQEITIPEGCVLDFKGGSLSNGIIVSNNTILNSTAYLIFNNINLKNNFIVSTSYSEWFYNNGDDAISINLALKYFNNITLLNKIYYLKSIQENGSCITVPEKAIIKGTLLHNVTTEGKSTILVDESIQYKSVLLVGGEVYIENISIKGLYKDDINKNAIIKTNNIASRLNFINVNVAGGYYGFDLGTYLSYLQRCTSNYNHVGFYIHGGVNENNITNIEGTSTILNSCYSVDSVKHGYLIKGMIYSTLISCAADGCGAPTYGNLNNNDDINYPYLLEECNGITLNSCGLEQSLKIIKFYLCKNISINNCNFFLNKRKDVVLNSSFELTKIIDIQYSVYININNNAIKKDLLKNYYNDNTNLIEIYNNKSDLINLNYSDGYPNIKLSNIKNKGFIDLNKNLIYKGGIKINEYDKEFSNFNDSVNDIKNNMNNMFYNKNILYKIKYINNVETYGGKIENCKIHINLNNNNLHIVNSISFYNCDVTIINGTIKNHSTIDTINNGIIFNNCIVKINNCAIIINNCTINDIFIKNIDSNINVNNCTFYCPDKNNYNKIINNIIGYNDNTWWDSLLTTTKILIPNIIYNYKNLKFIANDDFKSVSNVTKSISQIPLLPGDKNIFNGCRFYKDYIEYIMIDSIFYTTLGNTNSRPNINNNKLIGFQYFDTDIKKPIYWNGTKWVDATGTEV